MPENRRRTLATAGVGYGLIAAGAATRGRAIDDAHTALGLTKRRVPSSLAVLDAHRAKAPGSGRLVRRFAGGTGLVTAGAPAAAVGTHNLGRRKQGSTRAVSKQQKQPSIVTDAVAGTTEAWKDKGKSLRSGAPMRTRARAVGVSTTAAALGALAAHRGLDAAGRLVRVSPRLRHVTTATAAVPATLASLPVNRRLARRDGYTVTPTGTRKVNKAYSPPDYAGRHVTPRQQRLRTYAAGAAPVVGPIASARVAGSYAPPGQRHRAEARQVAGGPGAGLAAGALLGRKTGQLAARSPRVESGLRRAYSGVEHQHARLPAKARKVIKLKSGAKMPAKAIGALAGYEAGKAIVGNVGGQLATSRNLAAQRRYDGHHRFGKVDNPHNLPTVTSRGTPRKVHLRNGEAAACGTDGAFGLGVGPFAETHDEVTCEGCKRILGVSKSIGTPVMTRHQVKSQVRRKRISAALNTAGGVAGLGAVSLVGAKSPGLAVRRERLLVAGAGIGGVNALNSATIARREAHAEKASIAKRCGAGILVPIAKASPPIKTDMDDHTARRLVHGKGGYGLTGPLPHQLDRPTRQKAYEARYIAAGGKKANRWQHAAQTAGAVTNASVAGATAGGIGILASESARAKRAVKKPKVAAAIARHPKLAKVTASSLKHGSERFAVGAGVVGGLGQLAANHAKKRRASYTNAPGGVAASALRRMQAYSPPGG